MLVIRLCIFCVRFLAFGNARLLHYQCRLQSEREVSYTLCFLKKSFCFFFLFCWGFFRIMVRLCMCFLGDQRFVELHSSTYLLFMNAWYKVCKNFNKKAMSCRRARFLSLTTSINEHFQHGDDGSHWEFQSLDGVIMFLLLSSVGWNNCRGHFDNIQLDFKWRK